MGQRRWGVIGLFLVGVPFSFFLYNAVYNSQPESPAPTIAINKPALRLSQSVTAKVPLKIIASPPEQQVALPVVEPVPVVKSAEPALNKETSSPSNSNISKDNSLVKEPLDSVFFGYLKLVGVIVSPYNPMKNKAIIENRLTARQKLYTSGTLTPYGARIKKINKQGITLEKNGVEKTLLISDELGDLTDIAVLKSQGYKKIAEREWLITPNSLIKDTDSLLQLVSEISIRPQFNSMSIEGLKLKDIKPDGVINELGLKAGDMISSVNGKTLNINSVTDAYDIYRQIRNEPRISLGLSRKDQDINLTYHIISDGPPNYNLKEVISSNRVAKMFMNKL